MAARAEPMSSSPPETPGGMPAATSLLNRSSRRAFLSAPDGISRVAFRAEMIVAIFDTSIRTLYPFLPRHIYIVAACRSSE
jgi:hypothetical protein